MLWKYYSNCLLGIYIQYKKNNDGYHAIVKIININSEKLYSHLMKLSINYHL